MQVHNLVQGTKEWHAYRAEKFNASDAPAMLGLSKYKTRTELLNERKTGLTPDIDSATQKLFDNGHKFEALARPIAEQIIGEELSPVTGSEGNLSASFDGLTFMGDIVFEHKTLNDEIRACNDIGDLPMMYKVQMQQQLMVSGAEKCLFLATSWDKNDQLLDSKHFWYLGDAEIAYDIVEGWGQFQIDLDAHVPTVSIEQPKAQAVLALPALFIQAKGEITTNNMKEYGDALAKRLTEVRSIVLVTDQNFADAKEAAKKLREGIEQAKLAKEAMLSQTVTVGEAARMIDTWCEDMRLTALQLEKDVKEKDLIKKQGMISAAQQSFINLISTLEKDTVPIKLNIPMPNFAEAIKGKSKYDSMQDAISTLVANSTISANQIAMDIREKQSWLQKNAGEYFFLFHDIQTIIHKPMDDLQLLVNSRIEQHMKITAEREAKIKADAEAVIMAKVLSQEVDQEKAKDSEKEPLGALDMSTAIGRLGTGTDNVELSAVVVEHQNEISSFFKTRNFSSQKEGEYRAVIVEFIKHQSTYNIKKAA